MKKTAKITLWTVAGFLFLLLLAAGVFCCAFVSYDPKITPAALSDMDYFTGARISQNILYRTLKSKTDSEIRNIKIRNNEMTSLMNLAENGEALLYLITGRKPAFMKDKNETYKVSYERGVYDFKVKLTGCWFNLCFVASGKARVAYSNGRTDIEFLSLKLGRTEMPVKIQEKVKKRIYAYLKNDRVYDVVRNSVQKIEYAPNGDVKVYYHPYRLRKYFINNMF